jgi:hypothetical protein
MDILPHCGAEGEALRDSALNVLRVHRAGLIRQCTAAAIRIAIASGEVCSDDSADLVG